MSLAVLLYLPNRPGGLWLCVRPQIGQALADFERALRDLEAALARRQIRAAAVNEFVEVFGEALRWSLMAAGCLDVLVVQAAFQGRMPRGSLHVFGFIHQFALICNLVMPFLDRIVAKLSAGKMSPWGDLSPRSMLSFSELTAVFRGGEGAEL